MVQKYTRFERARLIGARALQLSLGAPPLIEINQNDSFYAVAKREFLNGVLPLAVLRE